MSLYKAANDAILRDFGMRLANERAERGLTQSSVANSLGLSIAVLSKYELGKAFPRPDTLLDIRRLYGKSVDWLLTGAKQ